MLCSYRASIIKYLRQLRHDAIYIFVPLDEPMTLAVRNSSDNIKRIELEPLGKVTDFVFLRE